MTVSADKSELDGSGPSDEPDKLPKWSQKYDDMYIVYYTIYSGGLAGWLAGRLASWLTNAYLNYSVPTIYQRKVVVDVFFGAFDVFSTLIERSLKHRHGSESNDGSPLIQKIRLRCESLLSTQFTCECDMCANTDTWHVNGAKQSFSSGVNGWSRFGGCLWPLRIANKILPMPDNGKPPLRFAQPPKSIKCKRLRPPATPPFPAKLYWYTCNVNISAGSKEHGCRSANAASKNSAARSAVGARNSVGPPKKSSLK